MTPTRPSSPPTPSNRPRPDPSRVRPSGQQTSLNSGPLRERPAPRRNQPLSDISSKREYPMSASVVKAFHDAMKSMDTAALVASLADDLVVVEPPSLPYGGTTTSRDELFGMVVGYTELRALVSGRNGGGIWRRRPTRGSLHRDIRCSWQRRKHLVGPSRDIRGVERSDHQGGGLPTRHACAARLLPQKRAGVMNGFLPLPST